MTDNNLHGSAPDKCRTALVLIDVINDVEFPGAEKLMEFAVPMARRIRELKARVRQAGIPAIYINDNFGRWQSNFAALAKHCLSCRGRPVVKLLLPRKDDYFVLKPKHSGFYSTTLATLLRHLGAKRLILCGMAGNICVLFTANDAYMRDLKLWVPRDCVCSNTTRENEFALEQMRTVLKADVRAFDTVRPHPWLKPRAKG